MRCALSSTSTHPACYGLPNTITNQASSRISVGGLAIWVMRITRTCCCCCAVLLLVLCPLVPESPHWLLVAGDSDGAEALLRRMAAARGVKLPPGKLERSPVGTSAIDAGVNILLFPAVQPALQLQQLCCSESSLVLEALPSNTQDQVALVRFQL